MEIVRASKTSLICDFMVTGTLRKSGYREFRGLFACFARALKALGVEEGVTVVIYRSVISVAVVEQDLMIRI